MRNFLSFSFIITFFTCSLYVQAIEPDNVKHHADSLLTELVTFKGENPPLVDSIISFGKNYLNTRYHCGSSKDGVAGFDCSGFTSFVYSKFGFNLIHSSSAQAKQFPNIKKKEIRPGDLVFYSGRGRRGGIGHVGYVTEIHENGDFSFIHATNGAGVTISRSSEAYYVKRYRTAARVLNFDSVSSSSVVPMAMIEKKIEETTQAVTEEVTLPKYHEVKKGETLYSLSRQYGVSVSQLKSQNGLQDNLIKIKQQLKIH